MQEDLEEDSEPTSGDFAECLASQEEEASGAHPHGLQSRAMTRIPSRSGSDDGTTAILNQIEARELEAVSDTAGHRRAMDWTEICCSSSDATALAGLRVDGGCRGFLRVFCAAFLVAPLAKVSVTLLVGQLNRPLTGAELARLNGDSVGDPEAIGLVCSVGDAT